MQLLSSCGHVAQGEGPLNISLTLSSDLSHLRHDLLPIQLWLNLSLIPKIPSQGTDSMNDSMIHRVDISDAFHRNRWTSGRTIQLQVNRAAVLGEAMGRIKNIHAPERFRAQAKVVISGETAAEWSPVCASPIFQSCHTSE